MTIPTQDELEAYNRRNDTVILMKLQQISVDVKESAEKLDKHIEKTDYVIHGNGTPGLKSTIEVLKSRVSLISFVLAGAWTGIVGTYLKIKGA